MSLLCKIFGHRWQEISRFGNHPYKRVCKRCGIENSWIGEWSEIPIKEAIQCEVDRRLNEVAPNNLKAIKIEIEGKRVGGRICTDGKTNYLIVGAVATEEDYYYVGVTYDMKIRYISCVGGITPVKSPPSNFIGMISYRNVKPDEFKEKIMKAIDSEDQVLFTKLVISL